MHKTMTGSTSYETAKQHKAVGIDMDTAATVQNRISRATVVQKAKERQYAGTEIVEDQNRATKSKSLVGQSSQDT